MSATAAVVARQINPLDMSTIYADLANLYPDNPFGVDIGTAERRPGQLRLVEPAASFVSPEKQVTTGGLAPWQVKKVRHYIDERISHGIPLDELAQQVRLSTSYFSAAFKTTFGVSPHSYVVSCRVEHAKQRMLTTKAPLCEIALDCGLADQSHLSRVFRRVTGTTPSAWRRYFSRPDGAVALQ
ncbi:helix-turn-helix domain-containing protein [Aliirhizobium smilacinae]|uniref:Helix-turn-helix transcriptional regulator n=1 Tax=Aliirhizobium smilacinae TaxID=1395944 RepID=A0A5C4XFR2_9HYPH|nr:AraC family transcriptional regulator [Rhizobium smilacinae]TNM61314.1 helix-turn-helix transcriptional regulator [Rhizobium smilacinae]